MEYKFFPFPHNFVEGIKNICQVYTFINQECLVMTRLKELGRSGNYVHWNSTWPWLWISSQRGGVFWNYFVVTLFNQSTACLELRDGDQAEFLSRRLEQYEQTLRVMYQRLTETSGNNCLSAFISCSTSCLIASWRGHVSVRCWYITRKVCSYCSNLLDSNFAWSPSRNSKHASLWLNNDKIVSKNSSTLWRNS